MTAFTIRVIAVSAAVWTLGGCAKRLGDDECQKLLDHYVDLLVRSDQPGTSAEELLQMQRDARRQAAQDPAFRECSSEVSRSKYECAMKATSADLLEQCLL